MKFKSLVIVVFLIFSNLEINAQNYELEKVTVAELQEKVCPQDSAAPAAILLKKQERFLLLPVTPVSPQIMFMSLKSKFIKKKD